jgi:GntR family transcriptional regulator
MELDLKINWETPAGTQVAEKIKEMIRDGKYKPGERLPTVREVAAVVGVNFNTIARAYRSLRENGWVVMRQGRGAFVSKKPPIRMGSSSKEQKLQELARKYLAEVEKLNVSKGDALKAIEQIGFGEKL